MLWQFHFDYISPISNFWVLIWVPTYNSMYILMKGYKRNVVEDLTDSPSENDLENFFLSEDTENWTEEEKWKKLL